MAIITKGGTPEKGTPTVITLNKADLLLPETSNYLKYKSITFWHTSCNQEQRQINELIQEE